MGRSCCYLLSNVFGAFCFLEVGSNILISLLVSFPLIHPQKECVVHSSWELAFKRRISFSLPTKKQICLGKFWRERNFTPNPHPCTASHSHPHNPSLLQVDEKAEGQRSHFLQWLLNTDLGEVGIKRCSLENRMTLPLSAASLSRCWKSLVGVGVGVRTGKLSMST